MVYHNVRGMEVACPTDSGFVPLAFEPKDEFDGTAQWQIEGFHSKSDWRSFLDRLVGFLPPYYSAGGVNSTVVLQNRKQCEIELNDLEGRRTTFNSAMIVLTFGSTFFCYSCYRSNL